MSSKSSPAIGFKKKGVFDSIHDSIEEDVATLKKLMPGESKFEIAASETLDEKEKHLSYDLIYPGDYKFLAESKGTGKFKIQVLVQGKKETITDSHKVLHGKTGPNSIFELEFQIKKGQIPLNFEVILQDKSPFLKKASYAFRLTKSDDPEPVVQDKKENATPKMKELTEEQIRELNQNLPKEEKKKEQSTDGPKEIIKIKVCLGNSDTVYDYVDPKNSYEETFERIRKAYGDKLMKYKDNEDDLVSINSGSDLKGFLENVEKGKVPKIMLIERSGTPTDRGEPFSPLNGGTPLIPSTSIQSIPKKRQAITDWEKGGVIGKGAFGVVYQGILKETSQFIAVKQVDLKGGNFSEDKLKALEGEIDLLANLDHPNIVKYLGMQKTEDFLYIFIDLISGGSIESILKTFKKLPIPVIRNYTKQILLGLEYLHSKNILHRDIKCGNVLVDKDGKVYLSDFGSAKKFTKELQKKEKVLEGTPNYMPPEVISESKYKKASDIYSLGCTVLEMLTGLPPWHQYLDNFHNPNEFLFWRKEKKPKLEIPENIPEDAKSFLDSCFQEYPENRKTATELLNHKFINTEKDESDFDSETEDDKPQEEKIEIKLDAPYVDDGFDFDDIKPPSPIEDEKKPSVDREIKSFLKKNAESFIQKPK